MPKISVLIPLYQTPENYLREAIDAVLSQTFSDFELIILNDSPDDSTPDAVVASYRDKRIRYARNEKNCGISESRNRLLDMAQGEYIAIHDHDDVSLPERFEKQAAYLDAHPEVGVVGCCVRELPSGKRINYPQNDQDIRMGLMWGCVIPHTGAMLRRSVLQQTGIKYEAAFSPSEDYALWCRLIPHTCFHNLQEEMVCYRQHAGNTSKYRAGQMNRSTYIVRAMVATENPMLYQMYLKCAVHTETIRLFGVLPILRRECCGIREKVYLFDHILLYTRKRVIKIHVKN